MRQRDFSYLRNHAASFNSSSFPSNFLVSLSFFIQPSLITIIYSYAHPRWTSYRHVVRFPKSSSMELKTMSSTLSTSLYEFCNTNRSLFLLSRFYRDSISTRRFHHTSTWLPRSRLVIAFPTHSILYSSFAEPCVIQIRTALFRALDVLDV